MFYKQGHKLLGCVCVFGLFQELYCGDALTLMEINTYYTTHITMSVSLPGLILSEIKGTNTKLYVSFFTSVVPIRANLLCL